MSTPEDRLDSGMSSTERGLPMTMGEVKGILKYQAMNAHHRMAMEFLIARVERLEAQIKELEDAAKDASHESRFNDRD